MKRLSCFVSALALSFTLTGCEKEVTVEVPATVEEPSEPSEEVIEEVAEEPVAGELPAVESVTTATFEMKHWPDAPEELIDVDDGVVLKYTNYPGYFEVFDSSVVKECILANEDKPFDVRFMRYKYVDEDAFTRAVAFKPCPDLEQKKLALQWLEAENLRAKIGASEATVDPPFSETGDPKSDIAGWAGRGFYKVDDKDPGPSPADEEWKTFCGPKTGTPCDQPNLEL